MKPKADRDAQRRSVHWAHIADYAILASKNTANVDEVDLVRWVEEALKDIRKSLAKHTTRI